MAWIVQNRLQQYKPTRTEPYITEAIRKEIVEKYFPRYPKKQAALLPLFHLIMHEYGFIAAQAIDGMSFRFSVVREAWTTADGRPLRDDAAINAELMRCPDDSRAMAVCSIELARREPFCARNAALLELITVMRSTPQEAGRYRCLPRWLRYLRYLLRG